MFGSNFTDLFPGANKVSREYGGQNKHKHRRWGEQRDGHLFQLNEQNQYHGGTGGKKRNGNGGMD